MAGLAAGGGALSACGPAKAAPTTAQSVIDLLFQAQWNAPWNTTAQRIANDFVQQQFNAKNRGLRARLWPGGAGGASGVLAAAIAGARTPDIVAGCCTAIPQYLSSGWLLPLEQRMRSSNVSPKLWSAGHMAALSLDGHQYALPSYEGPQVMVYRQDLLDSLGLPYPHANWNYTEAAALWQKCRVVRGNKRQVGASLEWFPGIEYLLRGFGGTLLDSTHTHCLLDSPAAIRAGTWFYDLIFSGATVYRNDVSGLTQSPPLEVFSACGGWDLYNMATQLGTNYKWDILPVPTWPTGFATFVNSDFYGILRNTPHPGPAWTLLQWMAAEPEWTRFEMRTTFTEPALLSLWSEWETVVTAAAPPLRGKALHYFKDAALSGGTYPHLFFKNNGNFADKIIAAGLQEIASHKVGVSLGFKNIAQQVNAYEAQSASSGATHNVLRKKFPTKGPDIAVVSPDL